MSIDYIVSSLPTLAFDAPAPISLARFATLIEGETTCERLLDMFRDLETQLRNALAEARHGETFKRPATGCSIYWKNRILACFQEKDVAQRERLLDKVWWDAAGELTPPSSPLGFGALATYYLRLRLADKRTRISTDAGTRAFDQLTAETKLSFTNSNK